MDYHLGPGESSCLPFNFTSWDFAMERALSLEFLRFAQMGIEDGKEIYEAVDLAPGKKPIFWGTGVTDCSLPRGVRFPGRVRGQSLIMTLDEHDMHFIDSLHAKTKP